MNKFWGNLFFYGALILAYLKTAEAMVRFSPSTLLGWHDPLVPVFWGYSAALLVEGVFAYALAKVIEITKDSQTRKVSIAVAVLALLFSALMNVIDTNYNEGIAVLDGTSAMVIVLRHVIILIPVIVGGLFGLIKVIDAQFPDFGSVPNRPKSFTGPRPNFSAQPSNRPQISGKSGNSNGHSNGQIKPLRPIPNFELDEPGPASGEDPFLPSNRR